MMERNEVGITALDEAISDSHLQMIKAAVPYVNISEQRFIAIFAKVQELKNTISFFQRTSDDLSACSLESDSKDPLDMLNDIRTYSTEQDRESIDMVINILNAFQMYQSYQETMRNAAENGEEGGDMFSMLKTMLPPEQQSMFDTYSMMMNNMNV